MQNFRCFFCLAVSVVFITLSIGCGNPKISGKVVFSDDKTPLTHGEVIFYGDKNIARGKIQSDGRYVMGSEKIKDGLPKGEYRIAIKGTQINTNFGKGLPIFKSVIDAKYSNADTSGLTLNVTQSQSFDIEVDRFSN